MQVLTLKPILGLKTDVAQNDLTLFQWVKENEVLTHAIDLDHMDFIRNENACSKALGKYLWSNSAIGSATGCNALFELDDGTNIDHIFLDHGKFYYYDSSKDPQNIDAATPVTFNTTAPSLYSLIQFSDYVVIADGLRTPYKWKHGDANLTKLILSGTEYVFKYLIEFQRRIIGAYSDQTNGDIEIRWTDALPTIASLDFDSANQLYKPLESDPITGISKMGANAAYLYGEESICRIDYYPGSSIPFGITQTVMGHGSINHHSIVNDGFANYFFDKNYGFIKYQGEYEIKKENIISRSIQPIIETISSNYQNRIIGTVLPFSHEICWAVPADSSVTNNKLLFYNTRTGQWRQQSFAARYIDFWTPYTSYTWTNLNTAYSTWSAASSAIGSWGAVTRQLPALVFGITDGHLYNNTGETNLGVPLQSYRMEPILDFGYPDKQKRVLEVWFDSLETSGSISSLIVYWRTGDTLNELLNASWEALTPLYLGIDLDHSDAVQYMDKTGKFHQFYWGNFFYNMSKYSINSIRIKYQIQGTY